MSEITFSSEDIGTKKVRRKPYIILMQAPPNSTKTDYDLDGAAEFLGLTRRNLKDICRLNRIVHERLNYRVYRFRRADLEDYQKRMRKQPKIKSLN